MRSHPRRPVRVCFLIDRLSRAGTESQLLALLTHLDRGRVEPSLALLDGTDDESRSLEPVGVPVLRLGLKSLVSPAAVAAAARLLAFWRRQRVDVVQTYFLDSTYFGVPLARLAGVRRVVRVRNNAGYWLTPKHRLLGRVVGRLADRTLTNSEAGRDAVLAAERLPARSVAVLENGVDLDRFAFAPPPDTGRSGGVRIGAVANLRPVKNLDLLIEAAARLAGRDGRLMFQVAGEGDQRPELDRLIAEKGLGARFQLLGAVADVPAFLARQDVAVLCSRSEGMSNALLEYMAAGRAIVATDVGANARLVRDGEAGLIVPAGEAEALVGAIGRLVGEPGLARRLGAAARERVRAEFSREAMRRRFEGFFEKLCFGRASPAARPGDLPSSRPPGQARRLAG